MAFSHVPAESWSLPGRAASLAQALDKILDAPALKGGIAGVEVARVSDGRVLYAQDPDTRLMPASNRKLFTAAAALELLGDDFTLKTDVLAAAKAGRAGHLAGRPDAARGRRWAAVRGGFG